MITLNIRMSWQVEMGYNLLLFSVWLYFPSFFSLALPCCGIELGAKTDHFLKQLSDIHTHFTQQLAKCVEVRKHTEFELHRTITHFLCVQQSAARWMSSRRDCLKVLLSPFLNNYCIPCAKLDLTRPDSSALA